MTQTTVMVTQDQIDDLRGMLDTRVDSDQSIKGLWPPVYELFKQYLTATGLPSVKSRRVKSLNTLKVTIVMGNAMRYVTSVSASVCSIMVYLKPKYLSTIPVLTTLLSCNNVDVPNKNSSNEPCPKGVTCLGDNTLTIPSTYIFSPALKAPAKGGHRKTILLIAEWPGFSGVNEANEKYIYHGAGESRRSILVLLRPLNSRKWQPDNTQFRRIYDFHVFGYKGDEKGTLLKAGPEFGLEKFVRNNSQKEKSVNGARAYIYRFHGRSEDSQSFVVCDGVDRKRIWKNIVDDSCSLYGRMGNIMFESSISRRHMMKHVIKIDDGIRKMISSFKPSM